MDQYIGKLLDNRYELLERIGNGGMSVVYKARCHRLNRLVAVKILKPDLASDAEFRRRFHDESQAVAMLSHANIVSVYDVSSSDDLDYIVMELIDGISLKQYMQKRGVPLNWREALHFTIQIVKALGHAHSRGIIHRDIKPHNVMVLRDGSIKVADFGIARLINGGESTLTQEALGSVHYISPEQARGSRIDGRSDLYSAGVVLYEMITGRLPFEGETPVSVAIQHINSIPISPRELNPDLPEALESITMKAMAPRAEQRYVSADDMLEALEEFRKNPNVSIPYTGKEPAEETEEVDEPTQVVPTVHVVQKSEEPAEEKPVKKQEKKQPERTSRAPKKQSKAKKKPSYEDDDDYYEEHRWSGAIAGLAAVLFILLFVCGIALFLWKSFFFPMLNEPETYTVPDVTGKTLAEIYADRSITGTFAIVEGEPIYSEDFELGEVVKQSPQGGETVRESGLTITVQINTELDVKELRMPNVMDWDQRKALSHLQDELGMDVTMEYEYSEEIEANHVMRFMPLDGMLLRPGDPVTIVISKGPETEDVSVPLVEGVDLETATEMLEGVELAVGKVTEVESETVEKGLVVFQSITATTEVPKGTAVNLQVSLGSTTSEPTPTGGQDPDPSVSPSGGDISANAVTKDISFNMVAYSGTIHLRVEVGDLLVMDGQVDTGIGTWRGTVSHTGRQRVNYYVNGELARYETIDFSS